MLRRITIRLLLTTLLSLYVTLSHASSDVGFIIHDKNFSLMLRFGFADIGQNEPSVEQEIIGADKLFFTCLQWVAAHHDELRKRDENVTIYLSMSDKTFGVQINDDEYRDSIDYIPERPASSILGKIEFMLNIPNRDFQNLNQIPIFLVRSKEYMDTYNNTDIYFGSIPGYMYSYSENNYLLMKWSWNNKSELAQRIKDIGAMVNQVKLNRSMTKNLLGKLD